MPALAEGWREDEPPWVHGGPCGQDARIPKTVSRGAWPTIEFATAELARAHVAEVKARRLPEIEKVEREVHARLKKEINYWDARAFDLKEQERAGRKTRLNWRNAARGKIEPAAMEAGMATERALGNTATDVSAGKVECDIVSYDPGARHLRFIEVKGRADGDDTLMVTRQEVITSLHEPEKIILALVEVTDGVAGEPRYVQGALDAREPPFDQDAIQFNLKRLLERAEVPG